MKDKNNSNRQFSHHSQALVHSLYNQIQTIHHLHHPIRICNNIQTDLHHNHRIHHCHNNLLMQHHLLHSRYCLNNPHLQVNRLNNTGSNSNKECKGEEEEEVVEVIYRIHRTQINGSNLDSKEFNKGI